MAMISLAHCAQVAQDAEVATVVGDGTYLSTAEAAAVIKVSTSTLIKLCDSGVIPFTWVGNRRRILSSKAEEYARRKAAEAAGE